MNTILRLFYDLTVYKDIIRQSFSRNLGRFLLGYLFISLSYSLYISYRQAPTAIQDLQSTISNINSTLPDNATLSLNESQLSSTNLDLPYTINNFMTINPTSDSSVLANSSAAITLGATHLRLLTAANTYEVRSYQEANFDQFDLSGLEVKQFLNQLSQTIKTSAPYLPLILLLPLFMGFSLFRFIHALFYSLIFYSITTIFKGEYKLSEFLHLTLHTIIVADMINLAVLVIYGPGFSVVFSLAFIGVSILTYLSLPLKKLKKII